jgi:hypothetical protein
MENTIKKMQSLIRKSNNSNLAILRASELNLESTQTDNDLRIDS